MLFNTQVTEAYGAADRVITLLRKARQEAATAAKATEAASNAVEAAPTEAVVDSAVQMAEERATAQAVTTAAVVRAKNVHVAKRPSDSLMFDAPTVINAFRDESVAASAGGNSGERVFSGIDTVQDNHHRCGEFIESSEGDAHCDGGDGWKGSGAVVVDLCSGKGFLATLLSFLLPDARLWLSSCYTRPLFSGLGGSA